MIRTRLTALFVAACVIALAPACPDSNAQTPGIPVASLTRPINCAGPNGEYSRGAVLLNEGSRYVCANVRSRDWQPVGVTWVRVEVLGNELVLSPPLAPGLCERTEN